MCPLQFINNIKHLSLILHGLNGTFIYHSSNVKNYSNGHKLEMGQPKKMLSGIIYFYTSRSILCSKYKNTHCYKNISESRQLAPDGPPNGPVVIWSKIQNRLIRAP